MAEVKSSPNISCRAFVHSTETILWAKKDLKNAKHKFNYDVMKNMNGGKQMKDVWETSLTKSSEKNMVNIQLKSLCNC